MMLPRLYNTVETPGEIIGFENMSIFKQFLEIAFSTTNKGEFPVNRINKEMGVGARAKITETLNELREKGFYPVGINGDKIIWKVVNKSKTQIEFEKGLGKYQNKSKENLMKMARAGYRKIMASNKI